MKKSVKKILTAVLAVNMILSSFAAVYADEIEAVTAPEITNADAAADAEYTTDVSENDAAEFVKKVKSKIAIPDTLTKFYGNKSVNKRGVTYDFSWTDDEHNNAVRVSINGKGDITNYYRENDTYYISSEYGGRYLLADINDDEIKSIARKWLEDIGASYINEIDFENASVHTSIYDTSVNFSAERVSGGIPVDSDSVYISINKRNKEVTHFYCDWNYEELPSTDGIISKEDAQAKYRQENAVELNYVLSRSDRKKAVIRYDVNDVVINAKTGEKTSDIYHYRGYGQNLMADAAGAAMKEAAEINLTPEEIKKTGELQNVISAEEAEAKILSLENVDISDLKVNSYNYHYDRDNEEYTLYISARNKDNYYSDFNIDALSGELKNFYLAGMDRYLSSRFVPEYQKNILPEDEAVSIAEEFIKKYNSKSAEYKFSDYKDNYVTFVRMVNDVPFYEDTITVTIDGESKSIFQYNTNYTKGVSFEGKDGIISLEEAYESFFKNQDIGLYYTMNYSDEEPEIQLVYKSDSRTGVYIDARSGAVKEMYPETEKVYPTDMSGHYAENAVKSLIDNGVVVLDGDRFEPEIKVSQKDAMAMLGTLVGWYEPRMTALSDEEIDNIYKNLIRRGIISAEEKNPSEIVTREKAVRYIMNAIGYTNIKHIDENVFVSGFNDVGAISSGYMKYVAAAKGLGIVRGDENGNFNPQGEVTKGQFAIMMYNALTDVH